jgi:hypothetical protein
MEGLRELRPARRRLEKSLPWVGALLVAAGVVFLIIRLVPSTNGNTDVSKTQHPTVVPQKPPKTVKLAPQAREVAGTFILTAVRRKHLEKAWNIVGPEIRQDLTFKQWMTGNIPVVPYLTPTDITPMKVDYSFKNQALVEVAMVPKKGYKGDTNIFWLELRRVGPAGHKHWLVWTWTPREAPPIPVNPGG